MKCEHCGVEQETRKFCEQCGLLMTRILVQTKHEERGEIPNVLRCPTCGHEQADGRVCEACGMVIPFYGKAPIQQEPLERKIDCPECGMPSAQPMCRNCGARIKGFEAEG
jgi:hypothetical protein